MTQSKFKYILICFFIIICTQSFGQNINKNIIRKITTRKKSVFFETGIFHNGASRVYSRLDIIRQHFSKKRGTERLVFQFSTSDIPAIYGYISNGENKVYIDIFNTKLKKSIKALGNTKYIKKIEFYPIDKELLSVELSLSNKASFDMFYLKDPGRLVIDIKG